MRASSSRGSSHSPVYGGVIRKLANASSCGDSSRWCTARTWHSALAVRARIRELTPRNALFEVLDTFEDLEICYHVGGSYASSVHGVPRQTHDIDLVADLTLAQATLLALRLGPSFYSDRDQIVTAVRAGRSFNLLHIPTGLKIDIFPAGSDPFDREELRRQEASIVGIFGAGRPSLASRIYSRVHSPLIRTPRELRTDQRGCSTGWWYSEAND